MVAIIIMAISSVVDAICFVYENKKIKRLEEKFENFEHVYHMYSDIWRIYQEIKGIDDNLRQLRGEGCNEQSGKTPYDEENTGV